MATMGAALTRVEPGAVEITMPVAPHVTQQHGFVHGGVVAAIADSAAGYAALSLMPAGAGVLTTEFKINFLSPAGGEALVARGRVVKAGRTLTLAVTEVFARTVGGGGAGDGNDGGGNRGGREKLCALMTATMMTVAGAAGVAD
jgi:uncharacterized protein (TIGR00369 family)